jgi:integrase
MARLTDISIRNLKAGPVRREIPDPDQRGLYIIVQPTGAKVFALRYRFGGKTRKLTLQAGIGLAAARREAADALFQVAKGIDPGVAKQRARDEQQAAQADTFQAIAEAFFRRDGAKLRTARNWRRYLERLVYPSLGQRPIEGIRRSDITRLLDGIEDANGPAAADTMLAVVRRIMNWHAARSDDYRSPIVRGMTRWKTSEHARDRVLNDDELRAIWHSAEGVYGGYLKFILLTAARPGEAAGMRIGELDGSAWTLPAGRNKTKRDLTRPLSAAAKEVLAKTPRIARSDYVFSATGSRLGGGSRRKQEIDRASGVVGWRLHDLRRTARSLMARAGVLDRHAEACLGHTIKGVEGIYNRHRYREEMLVAYEKLATLIGQIVAPQPNVVAMVRS